MPSAPKDLLHIAPSVWEARNSKHRSTTLVRATNTTRQRCMLVYVSLAMQTTGGRNQFQSLATKEFGVTSLRPTALLPVTLVISFRDIGSSCLDSRRCVLRSTHAVAQLLGDDSLPETKTRQGSEHSRRPLERCARHVLLKQFREKFNAEFRVLACAAFAQLAAVLSVLQWQVGTGPAVISWKRLTRSNPSEWPSVFSSLSCFLCLTH